MTTLTEMALQGSAFLLLLVLLRPMLKRLLTARWRYALWLLPLARLTLPLSFTSRLSLWHLLRRPTAASLMTSLPEGAPASALPGNAAALPAALPHAETIPSAASHALPAASLDWATLLPRLALGLWAVGIVAALAWLVVSNLRFHRATRQRKPLLDGGYPVPVYLVEHLASPCLVGLLRPRILVNRAALANETTLSMVLRHELTHLRRGDHVIAALRALTICLWWWNPLVWLAASLSREDGELACDEAATRRMDSAQRQLYGLSLIDLMRQQPNPAPRLGIGTAMGGGRRQMEERIMLIRNTPRRHWLGVLCCALCLAVLAPAVLTSAQGPASLPPKAPATDAQAIALAEDTIMTRVAYDFGVQGFEQPKVTTGSIPVGNNQVEVTSVSLTVVNPSLRERLTVHLDRETGAPVSIQGDHGDYWVNRAYAQQPMERVDQAAYILTPRAGERAVFLASQPDDYGWAKEALYNGTPVTVDGYVQTMGHYPREQFDDPREEWAHITVGRTDRFPGVAGYVPRVALSMAQPTGEAAAPLTGTLRAQGDAPVPVLSDTGLTDQREGSFSHGTAVRLLGRTRGFYHVQVEGVTGFVPLDAVAFAPVEQAVLDANQPVAYTEVEPGWEQREAAFQAEHVRMRNTYGDPNTWNLAQLAQLSRLSLEHGIAWNWDAQGRSVVYVEPGVGELTIEQAKELAFAEASRAFGITREQVRAEWVQYSYPLGAEEERTWSVRYTIAAPGHDCRVTLGRDGGLIETWQSEHPNRVDQRVEQISSDPFNYYMTVGVRSEPQEGEMAEQQAIERATQLFHAAYPEGERKAFVRTAHVEMDPAGGERWWRVEIVLDEDLPEPPVFYAVLMAPDGEKAYHSDHFRQTVEDARRGAQVVRMEQDKGPFFTWPLEEQARWSPENHGLPGEGDIPREQAIQAASQYMLAHHFTQQQLDQAAVHTSFLKGRQWYVHFVPQGVVPDGNLNIYSVLVDAVTGEVISAIDPNDPNSNG